MWLLVYFGTYLSILMVVYCLFAEFKYLPSNIFGLFVVLLAFLSFLLISSVHEIGHYISLRLKNYTIVSISVWLYLLPRGVNHTQWRSHEDIAMSCLSGPLAGVVASLILGYILTISIPTALLLAVIMVLMAVGLGYEDYKELLESRTR